MGWVYQLWQPKKDKQSRGFTSSELCDFWKEYCINGAYEGMRNHTLTQACVHGYLWHLPIRGCVEGWPEEVYTLTDPCVQELYEYSKAEGFIPKSYNIEDFLISHGLKPRHIVNSNT